MGGGFLYDFNGRRFFSPNCKRPGVKLPPPLFDPNNGILQGRDYQFVEFCQPQWWTKPHGYFAFTPRYAGVSTPPLQALMHIPKIVYDFERKIPIPQPKVWSTWRLLQSKIVHAVHLLLFASGAAAVRPAYPCARIDNKLELGKIRKAELKKDIFAAFSWFSVWFGCFAYAIAVSEAMTQEARDLNIRRIPKWIEILLADADTDLDSQQDGAGSNNRGELTLDETFVSDLANSCIGRFDASVERVGTFVTIPADDKEDTISIDWLVACHVPVWYAWGEREEEIARKNPFWQRYAPPPDAEQVTLWGSNPSTALAQVDTPPLDNALASSRPTKHYPVQRELEPHEKTWEAFFEQRATIRADVLAREGPKEK
ncbi:hypothetical protein EST38_g14691, partial [Candolleomyces aberdarensis]